MSGKATPITKKDFKDIDTSLWPKSKLDFSKWRRWEQFKPYPHNARTHPPAEVKLLSQLILKFGPDQDIVLDDQTLILKGHGRRLAGMEAGLPGFPALERHGLSPAEKSAMRIQDNAVALMAGWDNELVRFEIENLKRNDYPIELLGFGDAQLVQFTTVPGPPDGGFQEFGSDIPVDHQCPKCGYVGSGSWAPVQAPPQPPAKPEPERAAKKNK